jgi:hypothetical protein
MLSLGLQVCSICTSLAAWLRDGKSTSTSMLGPIHLDFSLESQARQTQATVAAGASLSFFKLINISLIRFLLLPSPPPT